MIFVFGSNLAGRHGKGAALDAKNYYGAIYGIGVGPMGHSYAIPTKDKNLQILSLADISLYVKEFIKYAEENLDLEFNITRIGCGLAGYKDSEIGPMFSKAPVNCNLPFEWRAFRM